eukprot:scaffold65695_cov42-Prasinocladus_malaysianus.AAC.2
MANTTSSAQASSGSQLQRSASGAADLIEVFYGPKLARMVTEIFHHDLEGFGYTPWDGTGYYDPLA